MFREGNAWITPQQILYLNIEPQSGARINAAIFVVTEADLEHFDRREWIYDRVAVTPQLRGVRVEGGTAWAYVAKPKHLMAPPASPAVAAIRQTYLDILARGHHDLGADFLALYNKTTDSAPPHLIVNDVRREDA
jgi:hypothetical protein